jgi:CRP/FNR family transcriptional regulator, cyclic AMP receptor protein
MASPGSPVAPAHGAPPPSAPIGEIRTASLLDLDPDLGRQLTPALREQVRAWLVVQVWPLKRGEWHVRPEPSGDLMGLLVLDGVLTRNVSLGRIAYPELLGAGDLLRPWQPHARRSPLAVQIDWQVVEPARVAVLDRRFAGLVGRWPEIVDELVGRAQRRADELDLHMAIAQLPLLELRLLALLWHLAGRWGTQRADGVLVPVRLTHSLLAALVLGRRSSTSRALASLTRRGLVTHSDDGWLLRGDPPTELHTLSRRDSAALGR